MSIRRDIIECILSGWDRDFGLELGSLTVRRLANFMEKNSNGNSIEQITEIYHDIIDEITDKVDDVAGYFDNETNAQNFESEFLRMVEEQGGPF